MNDKFLSLLGMARRSGNLCLGHDAAISSVVKNKARLCIVSVEGSERLRREMAHACSFEGKSIPVIVADYSIQELSGAIGSKAAVITVTDENFASALMKRYEEGQHKTDT